MRKLISLLLLTPLLLPAQKNYTALLEKFMQAQVNADEFTGTVLVAKKGKIIYEKAFGLADRELNVSNTVQTKFQVGSITKQFTAAGILQLVQADKLSLDDKLSKWFPDFPKADSVTIHMLLTHTSGIKNYTDLPEFWRMMSVPLEKDTMVAMFKKQPFDFSPGSQMSYSNSGYYLLGYIIEKVTGKSYSEYVFTNVIKKAGLKNTFVNRWDTIVPNRAKGYYRTDAGWKNAMYISMETPYSAGAIISSVEDLYQWNNALFANKIVSPTLFAKMITPNLNNYGYGLGIDSVQHHLRISHDGGIPGFVSTLARYPADELVITCLTNNQNTPVNGIATNLANIMFDMPVFYPHTHTAIKLDTVQLKQFTGKYIQQGNTKADTIKVKEGKLFWHPWWYGEELELKPESAASIFLVDKSMYDLHFEFQFDANGKVIKSFAVVDGTKKEMKREE